MTKIYGIRSVPGYKYVQNNSIFINGTRNNEIPASCIYFEDEVASGNVSNNIFIIYVYLVQQNIRSFY